MQVHDPLRENVECNTKDDPQILASMVQKERAKEREERFKRKIG